MDQTCDCSEILVVEDNEDVALLICRALKKFLPQCDIILSANGHEAQERLAAGNIPCFLVTDIQMPCMDGLELIAWIKGEPRLQNMPIAVLTGSDNPNYQERCQEFKVDGVFKKGEPLVDLITLISRISAETHLVPASAG